jgi:putative nucleotidyltransferase with HDIG domain
MATPQLAGTLQDIVLKRIESDNLIVPSLPDVASRALVLLRDEDPDLREVAKLVEREPIVAARLLRQANGAAMAGDAVGSISQACTRLGSRAVRALVLESSARQLFQSRDPAIAETARQMWQHSIAVGLLARDLAAILGTIDPESAYLAGLLHDVGKPIAAGILLEAERASDASRFTLREPGWLAAVQEVHRAIAVKLAEKWRLPEPSTRAIRESSEFDSTDRQSLGNVVCFSNSVAKLQGIYAGEFDKSDAEALVMIGRSLLGLEDEVVVRLSGTLRARVEAEAS